MAVNTRRSGKVAVNGQDPNKAAPKKLNPAVAPRVDGGQDESAYVRLVNCSTYVTPKREAFKSKTTDGLKPLVYEVPIKDLDRILRYANDQGEKFFKRVNPPGPGQPVVHAEDVNAAHVEEPKKMRDGIDDHSDDYVPPDQRELPDERGGEGGANEIEDTSQAGEMDVGVTRLRDRQNKPSGGVEV